MSKRLKDCFMRLRTP